MTARRIRVAGVRGDFRTPRGWPTPTDEWIRHNAFWQPPPGWTPKPGLKPAPADWQFWTTNDTWDAAATKYYEPIQGWMNSFYIAGATSTVIFISNFFFLRLHFLPLFACIIFAIAFICLVVFEVRKRRMNAELFVHATRGAEKARNERLAREYQRYLMDAA